MGWNWSQFNLLQGFTFKVMIQPAMKTLCSYSNFQWNTFNNSRSFNESSLLAKSKRKVNWAETKLWQFAELALFIPVIITWETTLLPESNILPVVPSLLYFLLPLEVTYPIAWIRFALDLTIVNIRLEDDSAVKHNTVPYCASVLLLSWSGPPMSAKAILQIWKRTPHGASTDSTSQRWWFPF